LLIIGLIVGGVLVGRDLIGAAAVRAQITQIEKFNTAANTFKEKTGYLPGDIPNPMAASFGFQTRGSLPGQGDGNGLLEGSDWNGAADGRVSSSGETVMFWVDLSAAHLIDQTFTTASPSNSAPCLNGTIAACFPLAKINSSNYVFVYSGGSYTSTWVSNGVNYFSLSDGTALAADGAPDSTPMLTVQQAYAIDLKMDDGLPQSGNVTATYLNFALNASTIVWAAGGGNQGASVYNGSNPSNLYGPSTVATAGSSTTCYDNSSAASGTPGVAGAAQHYSLEMNNGSDVNCALSFKMQAGD